MSQGKENHEIKHMKMYFKIKAVVKLKTNTYFTKARKTSHTLH